MANNDKKHRQANNKHPVHQIINLDEAGEFVPSIQQDFFVADLAYQCGNILTWVSDNSSEGLAEVLWKNNMRIKASQRFPDLDPDEVRRLVDRDWRVMNEQNRKSIVSNYKTAPRQNDLRTRLGNLKSRLNTVKSGTNSL